MRILGIDTALGACSVALLDDDRVMGHAKLEMQRGHAEALAPMVDETMRSASCEFSFLERIAVTTGPGTFTGQRVGLAFARALSLALKVPVVGVTTLDAMAREALDQESVDIAVAVCDAKRDEVYLGGRDRSGEAAIKPMLATIEGAIEQIRSIMRAMKGKLTLVGTGAKLIRPSLVGEPGQRVVAGDLIQPDAIYVARLGAELDPAAFPPKPLYLRAPDAKLPKSPFL